MSTKGTKIPERLQIPFAGITPAPTQEKGQDLFPTGNWRSIRPVYRDKLPPCNNACGTNEKIQGYLDLVKRVEEIARDKGCTASQLALAWVMAQGSDIVPIPGTKRRKYLEENVAANEIGLTEKDLRSIDEVFPAEAAAGGRYPEHMMALVNG